jgi:hypothetical protein
MHKSSWGAAALLLLLGACGCSKEKLNELVDQAKEKAAAGVDQASQAIQEKAKEATQAASAAGSSAQEQLGLAGSMAFTLDAPVTTKGCYVSFIAGRGGRPSVLQLRSYRAADQEAFPSALVQSQVEAASLNELAGQTLQAQSFVQAEESGPVWHTAGSEGVQLTIKAIADKQVVAELSGDAINTSTGQATPITAKLEGWLQ